MPPWHVVQLSLTRVHATYFEVRRASPLAEATSLRRRRCRNSCSRDGAILTLRPRRGDNSAADNRSGRVMCHCSRQNTVQLSCRSGGGAGAESLQPGVSLHSDCRSGRDRQAPHLATASREFPGGMKGGFKREGHRHMQGGPEDLRSGSGPRPPGCSGSSGL